MSICPGGEIGIHVPLRWVCRKVWRFKSSPGHHGLYGVMVSTRVCGTLSSGSNPDRDPRYMTHEFISDEPLSAPSHSDEHNESTVVASHHMAEEMYAFAPRDGVEQTLASSFEWQHVLDVRSEFEAYCTAVTKNRDYKALEKLKLLGMRCKEIAREHGTRFALYHIFIFSTPGDVIENVDTPDGDFEKAFREICVSV